jgi:hypothetical protein
LALSALVLAMATAAQAQSFNATAAARDYALGNIDRGAQAAAEQGLAEYVQRKQQQQGSEGESAIGVARPEDLSKARIAGGFEVHTITPGALVSSRGDMRGMTQSTGSWRFFVKVGQKPVGLITVERVDGKWTAVSFGGSGLSQELSDLIAEHGAANAGNLRYIRVYQAQSDFLEVVSPTDLQTRYALLGSARDSLKAEIEAATGVKAEKDGNRLREAYELMQPLRNVVQRNVGAHP